MDIDESFVGEFLDSSEPLANEQQVIPPNRVELQILSTMITNPECLESKQIAEILDLIDHNDVKQLIHWLKNIYLEIDDADYTNFIKAKLEENINSDCKNTIASALYNYNSLKFDKKIIDKTMIDLRFKLKREALKGKKAKLVQKQSQAITEEEGLKVLGDIQKVNEELDNLKK